MNTNNIPLIDLRAVIQMNDCMNHRACICSFTISIQFVIANDDRQADMKQWPHFTIINHLNVTCAWALISYTSINRIFRGHFVRGELCPVQEGFCPFASITRPLVHCSQLTKPGLHFTTNVRLAITDPTQQVLSDCVVRSSRVDCVTVG